MNTCPKCGATGNQPCWSYWPLADGSYTPRPTWLPHHARTPNPHHMSRTPNQPPHDHSDIRVGGRVTGAGVPFLSTAQEESNE